MGVFVADGGETHVRDLLEVGRAVSARSRTVPSSALACGARGE
jgi:hypothetical protein